MKERPILMATDSVKAILDGRKTMTRRVVKPQPWEMDKVYFKDFKKDYGGRKCPYGQVSDRLWARETWAIEGCGNRVPLTKDVWPEGYPISRLRYPTTDLPPIPPELADDSETPYWWNKRSPLFMPRWASRITLEITGIRVERLQEIEEHPEDYKAEGYIPLMLGKSAIDGKPFEASVDFAWYENLWDSLNAKRGYPWSSNPWVWVIEFKPTLQ